MTPRELYLELLEDRYGRYPFNRVERIGQYIGIVEESVGGYWRQRYLVNHIAAEAYELMSRGNKLTFLSEPDVLWSDVEKMEHNSNAYSFSARYPLFYVYEFENGVACVKWTLYPDGRYFMDEDGYGMEDNKASVLHGFIDEHARVVIPFQNKTFEEMETLRPEAERLVANMNT